MMRSPVITALLLAAGMSAAARPTDAADLQRKTIDGFDRYVAESERQMALTAGDPAQFTWVDRLPEPRRKTTLDSLRRGEMVLERLETRAAGKKLEAPGGMLHHWLGIAFIANGTVDGAIKILQDYDRHAEIYKPAIARAKTTARTTNATGDAFEIAVRFMMKKVITVVVNMDMQSQFTRPDPRRAMARLVSTRVTEVEDPDTPQEKELPVGTGGGYIWRLNSYWRIKEADGGIYLQCESISMSRTIPFGLGWIVGPFVTSIPKESLNFMMDTTRKQLAGR